MSPRQEFDHSTVMLTQSGNKELCRLGVLGLSDTAEHDLDKITTSSSRLVLNGYPVNDDDPVEREPTNSANK